VIFPLSVNFIKSSNINSSIQKGIREFIDLSEQVYFDQLAHTAHNIYAASYEKPIVLLSGPSGSGKTTSALRVQKLLEAKGMKVLTISMDNYFLPNEEYGTIPVDEYGNPDYESPHRLDIPLFSEHLEKLLKCEPVQIPIFNFKKQARKGFMPVSREKNRIIIIEGIHALNPEITEGVDDDSVTRIYVSVRTRITDDGNAVLHPQNIRLLRRLSRDRLFRGRSFDEIFGMMDSVSRGEQLYVMPHKHRAHIDIDTFMAYEASVYKAILLSELERAKDALSGSADYIQLLSILRQLEPIPADSVPSNSLIREFIGGSSFRY